MLKWLKDKKDNYDLQRSIDFEVEELKALEDTYDYFSSSYSEYGCIPISDDFVHRGDSAKSLIDFTMSSIDEQRKVINMLENKRNI